MALSPDEYLRFIRSVEPTTLITIVAGRLGRDVADSIAKEALEVAEGKRPAPQVVYPKF